MAAATNESAPSRRTWLVVGASRGIGHEFCTQLLSRGDRVYATVRKDSSTYFANYRESCQVLTCDVASEASIDAFVSRFRQAVKDERIDHVVLNAGVMRFPNRATEMSFDDFAHHLHTNTIGPIICAQRLLKANMKMGSITFISSDSGSAQCFREMEDGFAAYAASKAALNQALRHMAAELKRKNDKTVILSLHPGEVATDMANIEVGWEVEGQMSPQESVEGCIKVIESKDERDGGTFWTWKNEPYPW